MRPCANKNTMIHTIISLCTTAAFGVRGLLQMTLQERYDEEIHADSRDESHWDHDADNQH